MNAGQQMERHVFRHFAKRFERRAREVSTEACDVIGQSTPEGSGAADMVARLILILAAAEISARLHNKPHLSGTWEAAMIESKLITREQVRKAKLALLGRPTES